MLHGDLYFMFFYLFDEKGRILSISNIFLPEYTNRPFALCFAMSVIEDGEYYIVSYGEGDARCRLIRLDKKRVIRMLQSINTVTSSSLRFGYLYIPGMTDMTVSQMATETERRYSTY